MNTSITNEPHALLTLAEAAERIRSTDRHLKMLAAQRKITSYVVGKQLRFELDDLDRYLSTCKREAVSQ